MGEGQRKRSFQLEIIVAIFCCIGLGATGYSLFHSRNIEKAKVDVVSVGSIKPLGNDIRVKGEREQNWSSVERDTNVYRNDRVYTGKNSQAKVKLKNEQKFTVEPNSLIVISDGDKKQTVNFSSGGLLAELKKGAKLFVTFKNKETEISGDDQTVLRLHTDTDGTALNLVVVRGEAQVSTQDGTTANVVRANEKLEISKSDAEPQKSSIILNSPQAGAEIWSEEPEVKFQWEYESKNPAVLRVSTEPDFKTVVFEKQVSGQTASVPLPEKGVYFWQLIDTTNPSIQSPVSSFSLLKLVPPVVTPQSEILIETDEDHRALRDIRLTWNDLIASESYLLELSQDKDFSQIAERRETQSNSIAVEHLKVGQYYWRVTSSSPGRKNLTSNVGSLLVKEIEKSLAKLEVPTRQIAQVLVPQVATETPPTANPLPEPPPMATPTPEPTPLPVVTPTPTPKPKKQVMDTSPAEEAPRLAPVEKPEKAIEAQTTDSQSDTPVAKTYPSRIDPEFWIWGGFGENFQSYEQSIPSLSGTAKFQNIQGPTWAVIAGSQGQNFGAEVSHKQTPGKMEAPAGSTIRNGEYTWKTISTEGLYKPDDSNWRFRLGFQYHAMPFMVYSRTTNILEVKSNSLILATLGFDRYFLISKKLRAEWQMRYQLPVMSGTSSSDTFTVDPILAFDGSIGTVYRVDDKFRLGLFWYGQYHNYKFNYSGQSTVSGSQTLFYSNVELRAGWEF